MRNKILSIWLAVCMVLTMLPTSAMAEEADTSGASGEIIAFVPLAETEVSILTGTEIENLGLPESLSATVKTAVPADNGTQAEAVQDSSESEETESDNSAEATNSSDLQENVNDQQEDTNQKWEEKAMEIPVTWSSEPKYDMDAEGIYVFTPMIEGYTVNADLPEITVTVGTQLLGMALRTGIPATFGDFSVSIDKDGAMPTYEDGVLTFGTAGEYTVGMASGKSSTSNVLKVAVDGVTLNLNGVVIEARNGSSKVNDGATALSVTSDSVTLNVIENSFLTGGMGNPSFVGTGKSGAGISGSITVKGTATLTVTGGRGASSEGGPGGSGGDGINGDVTVTGSAILTATGGAAGEGYPINGIAGAGVRGNVDVSGAPTLVAICGSGMASMAIISADGADGGTITVGEGFTILAGNDKSSATAFTGTLTTAAYVAITLSSVELPTASEYAEASPVAAPGTDYVVDDINKILTISTTKGAAWWSANGASYLNYTVILDADIDVSAFRWTPVGDFHRAFTGSFDGQGHSISGLTVNVTEMYDLCAGLFGNVNGAMIQNLCIASGSIRASNIYNTCHTGSLAGYVYRSTIINCDNSADVYGGNTEVSGTGRVMVGGLAGSVVDNSTIINSYNTGNARAIGGPGVTAAYAGGLVGSLSAGSLVNCYNTGALSASKAQENYAAGLAGWVYNTVTTTSCYYQSADSLTGFGNTQSVTATVNGCGTFTADATLTAGTAEQFRSAQTLAYGSTLLAALNGWVSDQASTDYYTWAADRTPNVNGGYPVFGLTWTEPKVQWGVAGVEDTSPNTWVGSGSLTDAVAFANGLVSGTAYIKLLDDVDTTTTLEFASGKTTILDLNGKTIDGTSIPAGIDVNRNILTVNGKLTLCDSSTTSVAEQGKITGGHGAREGMGGGVYVHFSGIFIMTGGNVTGNTAVNGGGVGNYGTFTMRGGSIVGNSCVSGSGGSACGGGVANSSYFSMHGGSIIDNTVSVGGSGGGVFTDAMTLSGNVNISGNTVGTATNNVALMSIGSGGAAVEISGALANSTAIGVSIVELSRDNVYIPKAGVFTFGEDVVNSEYISKFVSDNSGFAVIAVGRQLKLAAAQIITKADATNGSFTVKVNGNQVPSGIEGQTVTVTPTANANYELDTITVTKTGDPNTIVTVTSGSFTMPAYAVTVSVTFKVSNTGLTDAQKLAAAKAAIMAALNRMSFSNSTTAADILSVAQAASLYGVTVTWNSANGFSKTQATTVVAGSIKGTLDLVLKQEGSRIGMDVTITKLSTGGNSGGGGSANLPTTKPTVSVTGSTENKATVDDKGNVRVTLTDKNIDDAINNAKAEAVKKGVNPGDITAIIHVTTDGKNANTATVNLPKTTQEQVISNKIAKVQLVIDRPDLSIGFDLTAITEINRQAKADVQLSATPMDNTKLSGNAKTAIGNRPAYDLKATYGIGKSVTDFGNGNINVEIPYTLQEGEIGENVHAIYVDTKGDITYLDDSRYDTQRERVMFSTRHLSIYGVAYKANCKFTDIEGHWAKDDILFVADGGLMTGTSATTFSPNGYMTRGMFVTALGRLANADTSTYKQSSFTDVKADAYYMGYIEWGVKNNILVGVGGGKFDPDGFVTREQMAVIMDKYASAMRIKLPEVYPQNIFADNAKMGAWAASSTKRIQMSGIIQSKSNNFYDPQGTATRAEVSAVLHRFVQQADFTDNAQG
ncbi:S-layer homology domain-containing protein [Anaerotignum sp.]|uniref:S-layer homology domain-containing protein n=1 Tax=Anaerotignum sp. TaxID=2039241 RepID=UPI002899CF51|nr:S-layer homology domain-containing protein [Anaerotignum sp.]